MGQCTLQIAWANEQPNSRGSGVAASMSSTVRRQIGGGRNERGAPHREVRGAILVVVGGRP